LFGKAEIEKNVILRYFSNFFVRANHQIASGQTRNDSRWSWSSHIIKSFV